MPKQIEFSRTIHSSGNELLMLINDILDLSKIESGTVALDFAEHRLADLTSYVERTHVAEARNVEFAVHVGARLPASIRSDIKRLQQILKNLLSNAFKFTHRGLVTLSIEEVFGGWTVDNESLNRAQDVIAFSVADTGIGISVDKQQIMFEAFQQADGSTSRKYGGTGLGLAISRELSKLLGGEIRLVSSPNKGSTFTLYLPLSGEMGRVARKAVTVADGDMPAPAAASSEPISAADARAAHEFVDAVVSDTRELQAAPQDDRLNIMPGDRVLLIVENDLVFVHFLLDVARERGFKGLVTPLGASALTLADQFKPDMITLDLFLPDMDGWRVLARLKHDLATRHLPICVISTDESRERALQLGAFAFLGKPIQSREILDNALVALASYVDGTPRKLVVALPESPAREQFVALTPGERLTPVIVPSREPLLAALTDDIG